MDSAGGVTGVAITSARQPQLDELTVRQTGALAYELSTVVERRLGEQQARVLAAAQAMSEADLGKLPLIDIAERDDDEGEAE